MNHWQVGEYIDAKGERWSLCERHAKATGERMEYMGGTEADCAECEFLGETPSGTAEHTPSPWFVDYDTGGYPQVRPQAEPGYTIATVITCINMPWEEVQANCRLIAAAPDLLQACKDAYEQMHGLIRRLSDAGLYGTPDDLYGGKNPATLMQLRTVIAAAGDDL